MTLFFLEFICVGDSGPCCFDDSPKDSELYYVFVMMDDTTYFVWLEPTQSCAVEVMVRYLLFWLETLGMPRVQVSNAASH